MLTALAIDDEPMALELLKTFASRIRELNLLGTYNSPISGFAAIQNYEPDLIFLDIQMPEISGISLAEKLHSEQMIIFTTAHSEYAVQGFNLNAVDYLLKPFDFNRFTLSIEKAIKQKQIHQSFNDGSEYIVVKVEYRNVKIMLNDILYIEALDNYVKIYTKAKMYLTLMNLKAIYELLPTSNFMRIHRSFIISLKKISDFTRENVVIEGKTIPVGRSYSNIFLSTIKK